MKVYELIQLLCTFDATDEIYIFGARIVSSADTDADLDAAKRRLAAAEEAPEVSPVDVSEFATGKVVIS